MDIVRDEHFDLRMRVVAHESAVSSMDDCRNCQTSTATPAEPGDLSWRLACRSDTAIGRRCVGAGMIGPRVAAHEVVRDHVDHAHPIEGSKGKN
jgi:hypothetical protein